jgi:hypothetical protein
VLINKRRHICQCTSSPRGAWTWISNHAETRDWTGKLQATAALTPGKNLLFTFNRSLSGTRYGLDVMTSQNNPWSLLGIEFRLFSPSPVTLLTELLWFIKKNKRT